MTGTLTLLLVSVIIFGIMRVLPGDVARIMLGGTGEGAVIDEGQLHAVREQLGLNRPLHDQYLMWLSGFLRLDLGNSYRYKTPVFDELKNRIPVTLELATLTMVVATLLAVPLGVLSAMRPGTWADYLSRMFGIVGLALPTFVAGTLVILVLSILFHWVPPLFYSDLFADPVENIKQMIWPAVALGLYFTAAVSRMTRSQMLEVLRDDYIRTAWAKGLRESVVIARHALRNAMLPVITIIGMQYAVLLGGTVIMEQIFAIPGLGRALIEAILFKDIPLVQTIIVVFSATIVAINIVIDLLYVYLDPRVRLQS